MRVFFLLTFATLTLFAQNKPELILPVGHKDNVKSADFSPDGNLLLTSSWDNTAKLWDTKSGKLLRNIAGHKKQLNGAYFNKDGTKFLTYGWDHSVKIWETSSGKLLHDLFIDTVSISGAEFSPDGKLVLVTGYEGIINVWDANKGTVVFPLKGQYGTIECGKFSPDGKLIVTLSWDRTAKIWDASTGNLLVTVPNEADWPLKTGFSGNSKYFFTTAMNGSVKLWETKTGKLIQNMRGKPESENMAVFSPDSKYLVTFNQGDTVEIWETASGKKKNEITYFLEDPGNICNLAFTPDGSKLVVSYLHANPVVWDMSTLGMAYFVDAMSSLVGATGISKDGKMAAFGDYNGRVISYDLEKGALIREFKGGTASVRSAEFSDDGKKIVVLSEGEVIRVWDAFSGKITGSLGDGIPGGWFASFNPEGEKVLTTGWNDNIFEWDPLQNKIVKNYPLPGGFIYRAAYTPDGKKIVAITDDSSGVVFDANTGEQVTKYRWQYGDMQTFSFSPDGKTIAAAMRDSLVLLIDPMTGKKIKSFVGHHSFVMSVAFSADGKKIVSGSLDQTVKVWDVKSGKELLTLGGHTAIVHLVAFSPDGKQIITFSEDKIAIVYSVVTGEELNRFSITGMAMDLSFKRGMLISHKNSLLTFYDLASAVELFSFASFGENDWVVLHPGGLFDASPGAMENMYYVQGLEVIAFSQLKDKYWEPGLFAKMMNDEQLRSVDAIDKELKLWPEVSEFEFKENYEKVTVSVENKGGGIGKLQIFLNGKEMTADARDGKIDPKQKTATITVDIKNHPYLVDGENKLEVITWNEAGTLSSSGDVAEFIHEKTKLAPSIYIVAVGVGDYAGDKLDLKYAGKDAKDFMTATSLGAEHLFTKERTHKYLLSTDDKNGVLPTKANILKTFTEIGKKANSEDVIVVYLAGHGINLGGEESDLYYLTQDAFSPNPEVYKDESVRKSTTISGGEIIDLLKNVAALKQVLIIDACASGKLVDNLADKRDISSSIVKAMERMKDRTGLHIITGSAADAVSYEASKYGQGLLTYSILSGMRGLALKDNRSIDISLLMQHAREMVPKLAQGIGGIQEPRIFSPKGAESFDIGILDDKEKALIPLAQEKPVFVNSVFLDANELIDVLSLSEKIDERLSLISESGTAATLLFWNVKSYPGAMKLTGTYTVKGDKVEVSFKIIKDKNTIKSITKSGNKNKLDDLVIEIVNAIVFK